MFQQIKKIPAIDKTLLGVILIFFLILIFITYAKWGHPVVDCFRNAYIADQLASGAILYKDIFFFYCPLVAYVNALLFKVFGVHLNVLYITGIMASIIVIITVYYLLRQLFDAAFTAILLSLFILQIILRPGIFQFIFPYSYEALYGTICLLFIIVSFVELVKSNFKSVKWLYFASFLTVLTAFIKQDTCIAAYLTFYTFMTVLFFLKKLNLKTLLKLISITLITPPLLYGFLTLFIPAKYLFEGLFAFNIFSPFFLKNYSGAQLSLWYLFTATKSFIIFVVTLFSLILIFYIPRIFNELITSKFKKHKKSLEITFIILLIFISFIFSRQLAAFYSYLMSYWSDYGIYQWVVVFILIYLIIKFINIAKNRKPLKENEYIVLIYAISGILFLYRSLIAVNLQSSNNYYVFTALIVIYYFFLKVLSEVLPEINTVYYKKAVSGSLIIIILAVLTNFIKVYNFKSVELKTSRGSFYMTPLRGIQISKAVDFVLTHTSPDDFIFAAPEESIIYFMSARKGASRYCQLLPGIVDKYNIEKEIINELINNKPKIAVVSNNAVVLIYGKVQWGQDYNRLVYKWLEKSFKLVDKIRIIDPKTNKLTSPYTIDIYEEDKTFEQLKNNLK